MDVANTAESERPSRKIAGRRCETRRTPKARTRVPAMKEGGPRQLGAAPSAASGLGHSTPASRTDPAVRPALGAVGAMVDVFDVAPAIRADRRHGRPSSGRPAAGKDVLAHVAARGRCAGGRPVRRLRLRRRRGEPRRERASGARARCLHRRRIGSRGRVRARARGHALPRRNRRAAARSSTAPPARPREPEGPARRRQDRASHRRARHRGIEPRPPGRRRGRQLPRGPLLSSRSGGRVRCPRLRERLDDLPELVHEPARRPGSRRSARRGRDARGLRAHPWPGNVRELKNVLACAVGLRRRRTRPCSSRLT